MPLCCPLLRGLCRACGIRPSALVGSTAEQTPAESWLSEYRDGERRGRRDAHAHRLCFAQGVASPQRGGVGPRSSWFHVTCILKLVSLNCNPLEHLNYS